MAAIPPNTNLEGFKKSMIDGIDGAFKKGVKYGRYLAQQEQLGQKETAQSEWISVEKRLPDKPGEVLICLFGNACVAYYHKNRYFKTRRGVVWWSKNDVTHWMPLPEPPKEEA